MATRKKRAKKTYFPTKLSIPTLSGGVGRQAPNKRLPNEAEDLVNVFCTTERSLDKRNGFSICEGSQSLNIPELDNKNMWWYWFNAGTDQRYLFGLNYDASEVTELLYAYRISDDGSVSQQEVDQEIDLDILNYLTHGNGNAKDNLRACAIGSSILILNNQVKAGFTSDGIADSGGRYNKFNLDGEKIDESEDLIGLPLEYKTAKTVDKNNEAEVWTKFTDYVWGQSAIDQTDNKKDYEGTSEAEDTDNLRFGIWKVKEGIESTSLPGPTNQSTVDTVPSQDSTNWERVEDEEDSTGYLWSEFLDPKDYVYPNSLKTHLGQSVVRLSELKFPPATEDKTAYNGDDSVRLAFQLLYPNIGDSEGRGKIIYLSQAFLSSSPGYYRVVDTEKSPYLDKVRTPEKMSVIDANRMPMQIFLDTEKNVWSIRKVEWNPRTSGTLSSNPGPSIFSENKEAVQKQIKAISFYRDRLFIASEDTLISSELGNFSNLFLKDPSNIVYTDPIDLKVSSNVYTPITFLRPFKDFLFLGTSGDTQYELIGSENQISPLTAEIAPTSFFPMTEDVEPLVMNNNLFFFSKKRLFIYFQRFEAAGQQAFELSRHVPDYLPDRFLDTTVSTAHNMIFALEGTSPASKIFCYRNQVRGEQIVQNAFFTFKTGGLRVASINAIEDDLYIVGILKDASGESFAQIMKMSLIPDDPEIPRVDCKKLVQFTETTYDPTENTTTFTFEPNENRLNLSLDVIVFGDGSNANIVELGYNTIKVEGNYANKNEGTIGIKYTTEIELSTQFLRDQNNTIIDGTLNLRYGIIRHRFSGNYNVSVGRKERDAKTFKFEYNINDENTTKTDGILYEKDGTFKFPILGFNDDLIIRVTSDFPNPMNLTNIELTGKFKRVSRFITS